MTKVNMHEAKSQLSRLGKLLAIIAAISRQRSISD